MDRLLLMHCFTRSVETGSFSAVARELRVGQPNVSRHIASLEKYLGVRLLHRSTRKLTLTDEGERYYAQARRILDATAEAESNARGGDRPRGLLRIECPAALGRTHVLPRAATFPTDYPDKQIDLQNSSVIESQAEIALKKCEARYRSLFDSIDGGFCIIEIKFDESGRAVDYQFIAVNKAFESQTGLKNAAGQWMRTLAPEHEQHWFDIYGKVLRTGESLRFENSTDALNHRWFDVFAYRIGEPGAYQVALLFSDISHRKRVETALEDSESRLDHAIAIAALGTFDWNLTTDQVRLSDRSRAIFGFARHEGQDADSIFRRVHPADLAWVHSKADTAIQNASRLELEYRIIVPEGSIKYIKCVGDVATQVGAATRMVGVFEDVTERRLYEERLRQLNSTLEERVQERTAQLQVSEARFRKVFQTSYQFQALLAFDGTVLDANAFSLQGIKAQLSDVVGKAFYETPWFSETQGMPAIVKSIIDTVATGKTVRREVRINLPEGGWRWFDFTLRPLQDADDAVIALIAEAIEMTERREAEEALRQSQKMEAVGQLTGGLAHDFNNLLAGITGSLELMQVRLGQGRVSELDKYMTAAQGAATRAAALTHRLLAFSRRQTLDPKPTNANRCIAEMEDLIKRTVGPAIAMEVLGASALWNTLVDPNQLESALLNLCINARDAMPHGGRLTIETANHSLDEAAAKTVDLPAGHYVYLRVTDTGTGMTPAVIARAFDPFFTTKPIGEGTGLGLSMVYGFVRQSGGQVRILSEVGSGSTLILYFPRHLGKEPEANALAKQIAARAGSGEVVLVIDDEPTVRMLIVTVLEDAGYTAIESSDGAGGLRILQSDAKIDLLITDVGLPGGMNGRQVADAGRALRPHLKVLFITGYAENAVVGDGQLTHGMQVLTKPFSLDALAKKIRSMIHDRGREVQQS